MSMFYCFECDRLLDGDWTESFEVDGEEMCIDCHCELFDEDGNRIDYDPTPWCIGCGAMTKAGCDCGPIAENH